MVTVPPDGPADGPPDNAAELADVDVRLDERGRVCPLPIIALGKAAVAAPGGTVIAVLSDDAAAAYDIPAWCSMRGADYLGSIDHGDHGEYFVRTGERGSVGRGQEEHTP